MSDDTQLAAVRQRGILDLINRNQSAKLGELRSTFGVSEATIRRDLAALEKRGVLSRTHGGAVANPPVALIMPNENRAVKDVAEKGRIGKAAMDLLFGDKTVFLDAGTTALEIARRAHEGTHCRFITNSLGIANTLRERNVRFLYLIGGSYLAANDSLVGSIAISAIRSLSFDIAFLSVTAVDIQRQQISAGSEVYSQVQREIVGASREIYVIADHTKFRGSAFVRTATFDQLDGVITTDMVDQEVIEKMRLANLEVIVA